MTSAVKNCLCCGETKSAAEFNRDAQKPDGLCRYCRPCARARQRASYKPRNRPVMVAEKRCPRCTELKPASAFTPDRTAADGLRTYCKPCGTKVATDRQARPENRAKAAARRTRERDAVLAHYGRRCVCCGEARREFLAVDHINNDGAEHRRKIHCPLTQWLIREGFPDGFQILCHNCNMAKGFYGTCPHTLASRVAI